MVNGRRFFESQQTAITPDLPMTRASFQYNSELNMPLHCYIWIQQLEGKRWQYKALISSKKAIHGLMAAEQCPWQGFQIGSGKGCS
ncbi:hypothetical protein K492DRAFT_192685 [Lichtheimia hyalospora FSU 10163]|nr:hypothetical protein K492DRAFT_192685 [Lichtheimia hyalospora FSU 10163]